MAISKLSIIVPAYNEGRTIYSVLEVLHRLDLHQVQQKEIVVVNDCSKDNTEAEILRFISDYPESIISYVKHEVNQGKGAGIRSGLQRASGDYIIIQDADLELDPNNINDLLIPVLRVKADVVFGSRFSKGLTIRSILSFKHYLANRFLTFLSNLFSGIYISDMETCYKLVRADIFKSIELKENRFGFEPEITAKLAKKQKEIKFFEVGISYYSRTYKEGKKIGFVDGMRAIYCIVRYNLF